MRRTMARLAATLAMMAALIVTTAVGGSAQAVTTFTVTFLQCETTDGGLLGTVGYFTGGPAENAGGCLATAPVGFEIVSVAAQTGGVYATTDVNGVAIVNLDLTGTVEIFLNQNFTNVVATFSATAGQNAEFTFLLYTGGTTGSFLLTKVDVVTNQVIPGAGFVLYDPSCQTAITGEVITDANGQALFTGLAPGAYCIVETTVPPGYQGPLVSATTVFAGRQATLGLANHPAPTSTATAEPTPTRQPTATAEPSAPLDATATIEPGDQGQPAAPNPTATLPSAATAGPDPTTTTVRPPTSTAIATSAVGAVTTLPNTGASGELAIGGRGVWGTLTMAAVALAALSGSRGDWRRRV